MDQANAIPASAKNQRKEIIAWCMYDWANSAYSTIYITVLVSTCNESPCCRATLGLTAWGWGIGITMLVHGLSLAHPGRHCRRPGQQARLAGRLTTLVAAGSSASDVLRARRTVPG